MIIIRQFQQKNLGREFRDRIWTSWGQFKGDTKRRLKLAYFLFFKKKKKLCKYFHLQASSGCFTNVYVTEVLLCVCASDFSCSCLGHIGSLVPMKNRKSGLAFTELTLLNVIPPFWHDVTDRLPNTTRAAHVPCLELSNVDFFSYNFMFCCCCCLIVVKKKGKKEGNQTW